MDYFISDTHFAHANLLLFEQRPFETIAEHDDFILTLLEKKLREGDILYHLGDFIFSDACKDESLKRWKALPCRKVLIKGNHDKKKMSYYSEYFDEVYDTPIYYKRRVVLSHYPVPVTDGTLNIHGHLHGSILDGDNYLNANIHVNKYKLITGDEIDKRIGALPVDNRRFLCEWFAHKQKFIEPRHDDLPVTPEGFADFEKLATKKLNSTE